MINADTITSFLKDDLDVDTSTVSSDSPLFSSGIIDSFSLVSLMAFIEDNGNIRINPTEVTIENLDSIDRIIQFVNNKR